MREFRQQHGRAGERYWMIGFESPPGKPVETIVMEWGGVKDGRRKKHGRTKDRPGPKGKPGTKAFVNAQDNACFNADRLIRKKIEEGYVEVGLDGRLVVGGSADEINHAGPLPKNLCFSKPRNSIGKKKLDKLERDGDLILTRKINGMMVIAHSDHKGRVHLYSRRMDEVTSHFSHLVRALELNLRIPPECILLFEAFMGEGNSQDEFEAVQSIMRSKPDRADNLQIDNGYVKFYLFRVPIWKGQHLEEINTCGEQCALIENTFADRFLDNEAVGMWAEQFLYALENIDVPVSDALDLAEKYGWEGFVGYQKSAKMAGYSFSFHGKPDRPGCCFKIKPAYEDDFIAYWVPQKGTKKRPMGHYGSGKNSESVGSISLYQLDGSGKEVYICECSGFTDSDREYFQWLADYPLTVQVEYSSRSYRSKGRKTNALQFPRFIRSREDKSVLECVNPDL